MEHRLKREHSGFRKIRKGEPLRWMVGRYVYYDEAGDVIRTDTWEPEGILDIWKYLKEKGVK